MNFKEMFPYLHHCFGAYFHLDWREEYENEEEAIKASVYDDGAQDAFSTLRELDQFIALGLQEPELREAIVKDFGSGYYPGYTLKYVSEVYDWLHWVRDTMAKYAEEKSAEEKKSQGKELGRG